MAKYFSMLHISTNLVYPGCVPDWCSSFGLEPHAHLCLRLVGPCRGDLETSSFLAVHPCVLVSESDTGRRADHRVELVNVCGRGLTLALVHEVVYR
jgi:hypothetical protein